ncbi:MAG TPA: Hsp20/alpha crystallin family protein [Verrucomicrobiae bacterium]|nr:Hsp20/alpha crystallin family protein [Verrucomicrobiae bacterium]
MKATLEKGTSQTNEKSRAMEYVAPEVNIYEAKDGYLLEAEMPGVNKEGLEITLEANELTIVGHRNSETVSGEPIFLERRAADYRRVFELDPAIDTSKVSAKIEQGVLQLTLPKSERVKPRKIAVD